MTYHSSYHSPNMILVKWNENIKTYRIIQFFCYYFRYFTVGFISVHSRYLIVVGFFIYFLSNNSLVTRRFIFYFYETHLYCVIKYNNGIMYTQWSLGKRHKNISLYLCLSMYCYRFSTFFLNIILSPSIITTYYL